MFLQKWVCFEQRAFETSYIIQILHFALFCLVLLCLFNAKKDTSKWMSNIPCTRKLTDNDNSLLLNAYCKLNTVLYASCVSFQHILITTSIARTISSILKMEKLRQRISYLPPLAQIVSAKHSTKTKAGWLLCTYARVHSGSENELCSEADVVYSKGKWQMFMLRAQLGKRLKLLRRVASS